MALTTPNHPPASPALELHIEELILHGFAASDRRHIGAAIKQELSRLLSEANPGTLPANSVELSRLDAGTFRLDPGARPYTVGRNVAERVFSQLTRSTAPAGNGGPRHV